MITIILNGAERQLAATSNVAVLVEELQLSDKTIAIAINRQIIPRSRWNEQMLANADQVEVVRAIGGG
jgi:sulfur carrier protein